MKFSTGQKINAGFGAALLILSVIGVITYRSSIADSRAAREVARTQQAVETLEGILSYLKDVETAQRGFVITGRDEYLEPFREGLPHLETEIQQAHLLLAGTPVQRDRLARVEALAAERLKRATLVVWTREQRGSRAAAALIADGTGKHLMDQLRVAVGVMQADETVRLARLNQRAEEGARTTRWIIGLGSGLAFLIVGIASLVIRRDFRERQRAEAALEEERIFINALLLNLEDGIVACGAEGTLTLFNRATRDFHGMPPESILPEEWAEHYALYLPDGTTPMPADAVPLFRALNGEHVRDVEVVIAPGNGQPKRRVLASGQALFDAQGRKLGAVVAMHDVTRQREAEELLRHERDFAFQVMNTMGQGLAITDEQDRLIYVNPALARMTGQSPDALIGLSTADLIDPADRETSESARRKREAALPGQSVTTSTEVRLRRADGEALFALINSVPRWQGGRAQGAISVVSNLTSRRHMEEALRQSEERFRRLSTATLEGIVLHERGVVIDANDSAARLFGYELDDLIGRHILDLAPRSWHATILDHTRNGDDEPYEAIGLRQDGATFPVEIQERAIQFGERTVHVAAVRDVTERRRTEETLRESEEFLRRTLESSPDCIKVLDLDANLISLNSTGQCLLEIDDFEPYRNADWTGFWNGADRDAARNAVAAARAGQIGSFQGFCRTARGTPKWWDCVVSPILGADGMPEQLLAISRDVTERTNAQNAMESLRLRYEMILQSAGDGIYGLDRDGRTNFVNHAAARMLGYEPDELLGTVQHALVHHKRADGTAYPIDECPVHDCLRNGSVHSVADDVFWRKDGSSFAVEYVTTPIEEEGEIVGAVVTFRDVTERREVERVKDEFVSVVSHELRTPLTSIRGSLGLLASGRMGTLESRGQRLLDIATQNTDRLVRLINDILDLERLQSGKAALDKRACDAAELLRQAAEVLRSAADGAGVTLVADPVAAQVIADPDRIVQVLVNLLGNALKFSPAGATVRLGAEQHGAELRFRVRDEGRGIPAEKIESIFGRFQQVDSSDSRQKGGSGLGLAICRSIVEQYGGRIWAESVPGEGSTFWFTLPAPAPEHATSERRGPGPCVLIVEDDPDLTQVLIGMLDEYGIEAHHASRGADAIRLAIRLRPDLMILDVVLPGGDGFEVASRLRGEPPLDRMPLLVYSAREIDPADRDRLRLGPTTFLTKALVTPEQLHQQIAVLLRVPALAA